mgnify:CR=1 FL=1
MSCWEHMMECCNGRGRFLLEAILWWIFICLPINFVSIIFAVQAPTYVHSDEDTYHYGYGYNSIYEANLSTSSSQGNLNESFFNDFQFRVFLKKCIWLCFGYVIVFLMLIMEIVFIFHKSNQG